MDVRRALITGASLGIGRALTRELALRGVKDFVLVARTEADLSEVARDLEATGVTVACMVQDVADTEALVERMRAEDDARPIDLVVANAGVGAAGPRSLAWESWRDAMRVNFLGAAATLGALAERMAERRRGHLVTVSSLSSFAALPRSIPYCVPKAGTNMLMDCLRMDLAPFDVTVTNVYLGFVDTRMVARSTHAMPQRMTADAAARGIANAIARRRASVILPRALGLSVLALSRVPRPLRDRLYRAVDRFAG